MLTISHLTKTFGTLAAVDDLSLGVASGEILACIGPNGSGKTTTVKVLAGMYMASNGTATVGGVDLAQKPEEAKALIGYVPDEPYVYEKMSGREFLGFVGALYGMKREDANTQAQVYLKYFPGLEEAIDGFVESYSRGNKQKLAFVAAFMHRPKLLLIDEPMVGLDPQSAIAVKKLITAFAKDGGAVFLCTHTLTVAEELAQRVCVLKKGKAIATGTSEELRTKAGLKSDASLEDVYLELTKNPS